MPDQFDANFRMSDAEQAKFAKTGPGTVVMVVGSSGSGKDTLLRAAAKILITNPDIVFPRRAITRVTDPRSEDHDTIGFAEFRSLRQQGKVGLCWEAHGNGYVIPHSIRSDIAAGKTLVFNGSRAAIAEAQSRYDNLGVVNIEVPTSVLEARLISRGREATTEIASRLARPGVAIPDDVETITIQNDKTVEAGGIALAAAIRLLSKTDSQR